MVGGTTGVPLAGPVWSDQSLSIGTAGHGTPDQVDAEQSSRAGAQRAAFQERRGAQESGRVARVRSLQHPARLFATWSSRVVAVMPCAGIDDSRPTCRDPVTEGYPRLSRLRFRPATESAVDRILPSDGHAGLPTHSHSTADSDRPSEGRQCGTSALLRHQMRSEVTPESSRWRRRACVLVQSCRGRLCRLGRLCDDGIGDCRAGVVVEVRCEWLRFPARPNGHESRALGPRDGDVQHCGRGVRGDAAASATFSSVTVPAGRMPMSLNKPSTVVDRDLDSSNLAGNVPA